MTARHRVRSSRAVRLRDAMLAVDVGILLLAVGYCAITSWAIWVICATPSG